MQPQPDPAMVRAEPFPLPGEIMTELPMPVPVPVPLPFARHLLETLRLGLPVALARAAVLFMLLVTTILVGHAGGMELGAFSLAMAPQLVLMLVGIGLCQGVLVLVAQAHGAGEQGRCGAVLRVGVLQALGFGMVIGLLLQGAGPVFAAMGQAPDLAERAGRVSAILGWGMPGVLVFNACTFFLEGLGRPRPGLLVMIAGNALSAGLAWLWVADHGAVGAALAMTVTRCLMGVALALYVWRLRDHASLGVRGSLSHTVRHELPTLGRRLRRLGYAPALAQGLEVGSFSGLILMAGYLGPAALGGYQITMNLVATVFMIGVGLSTASAVRVGQAVGRHDRVNMARAGWAAMLLVVGLTGAIGLSFGSLAEGIAAIYTNDPAVLAVAIPVIGLAGWFVVFDGLQGVCMGALRGCGDVWMPTALQLVAFWALAMPIGGLLAFQTDLGALGLFLGLTVGVVAATVLLAGRFALVSRRALARA